MRRCQFPSNPIFEIFLSVPIHIKYTLFRKNKVIFHMTLVIIKFSNDYYSHRYNRRPEMYFAAAEYTSSRVNYQFFSIVGIITSFPWRSFSETTLSIDVLGPKCISSWKKQTNIPKNVFRHVHFKIKIICKALGRTYWFCNVV